MRTTRELEAAARRTNERLFGVSGAHCEWDGKWRSVRPLRRGRGGAGFGCLVLLTLCLLVGLALLALGVWACPADRCADGDIGVGEDGTIYVCESGVMVPTTTWN